MLSDMTSDEAPDRFVVLEGAFNLRDLGGYPTRDGGRLRTGLVYRGDSPRRLTSGDRSVVASLGIGHVVDLRGGTEADDGTWASGPSTQRHNFEVLDPSRAAAAPIASAVVDNDTFVDRYLYRLERAATEFVAAASVVARGAEEGVLIHCTAGKDRTGLLAAALLDALGVDDELIVEDYALSGPAMQDLIAHQVAHPRSDELSLVDLPPIVVDAPAAVMEGFLSACDIRYGGLATFFVDRGFSTADLDRLRTAMLEYE